MWRHRSTNVQDDEVTLTRELRPLTSTKPNSITLMATMMDSKMFQLTWMHHNGGTGEQKVTLATADIIVLLEVSP